MLAAALPDTQIGMNAAVLINPRARAATRDPSLLDPARLQTLFERHQIQAQIEFLNKTDDGQLAKRRWDGVSMVVAGGGDGTISSVAETAVAQGIPLGILPLGTCNHFAKDLRIPLSIDGAVGAIAERNCCSVDVGEVNGRIFLNNSSLGAYPRWVLDREAQRHELGRAKWMANLIGLFRVLRHRPLVHVRIELQGKTIRRTSPFVFIGNNPYDVRLFSARMRPRLNQGHLSLYTARCTGWSCFLLLILRSAFHHLERAPEFESHEASEIRVETQRRTVRASKDGEVLHLESPLEYRIRPGALKVLAPKNSAAAL